MSLRIATFAILIFLTGCRDWKPSRASWPDRSLIGLRTLGMKRSIVYPYSVIAGGVETRADVQEAADRDPDVARHYDEVRIAGLEPVSLKSDTMAYVSFRKGGNIYWTSRPVRLAKGERILSDGRHCVRGRCGNRISWEPRTPVLPKEFREPDTAQLNTPEVRGQQIDELPIPPVFATVLSAGNIPVSIANLIAATGMPLASAPPFTGAVETGGGTSGAGGGGGASGGGQGGGMSEATGSLSSSNFVPAILYVSTGTPVTPVVVYPATPSTGTPGVASYPVPVGVVVPPITWTPSTVRPEIITTSVHTAPPSDYPPYYPPSSPSPSNPTPPPSNPTPPPSNPTPPDQPPAPGPPSKPPCPPPTPPVDMPPDTSVPEPGTVGLLAVGLAGLVAVRIRRRTTARKRPT